MRAWDAPVRAVLDLPVELVDAIADAVAERLASRLPGPGQPEGWRLVDVEEAAATLGRSTRWVRDRAKRGELPWVRLDGGALAFDPEDLRAFALERRIPVAGSVAAGREAA